MSEARREAALRARRVLLLGGLAFWFALLVLTAGSDLPMADALLLALLLVAAPTLSLAQLPLVEGAMIERLSVYWGSIGSLWMLGAAAWLVGTRTGGAAAIGLTALPPGEWVAWSVGLTLAGLAIIVVFRAIAGAAGVRDSPLLRELLPRTRKERSVFALLSLAAGVGEELAYRGYAISVLAPTVGTLEAAGVTSVVFGILHGYQGLLGTLRTTVMGGVLAWGFLAAGSLWPAIVAHVAIDLVAGIVLGERLLTSTESSGVAAPELHSSES